MVDHYLFIGNKIIFFLCFIQILLVVIKFFKNMRYTITTQ